MIFSALALPQALVAVHQCRYTNYGRRTPRPCSKMLQGLRGMNIKHTHCMEESMIWRPSVQIGMSLMLLQQITGQPSVLYYAVSSFPYSISRHPCRPAALTASRSSSYQ